MDARRVIRLGHVLLHTLAALAIVGVFSSSNLAQGSTNALEASSPRAVGDSGRLILKLSGEPLIGAAADVAMAQAAALDREQAMAIDALQQVPGTLLEYTYRTAFNGLAVRVSSIDASVIAALDALPGVEAVFRERAYEPSLYESLDAIGAVSLWSQGGGRDQAGEGVRIALLDSGIAIDHPMMDPSGFAYPPGFPKGDITATSAKVIAARAFFRPGDPPLTGDDTALPGPNGSGHGTHLAGVAAGVPVTASWPGGEGEISGVAPRAQLMSYRIFYPSSSGGSERAYTAEILLAIDRAVSDGANVILAAWSSAAIRMPLATPEAQALEAAMASGVVIVAAAGNDGPAYGSASRLPGGLERVITVGSQGQPYGKALFGAGISSQVGPLPLQDVASVAPDSSREACAPLPANSLSGRAALVARGGCPFADKAYHTQQAGAMLTVISNSQDRVVEMACTGSYCGTGVVSVPTIMIASSLGANLRAWLASSPIVTPTVTVDPVGRIASFNPQWVTPSSARGPAFARVLKPDLVAPGQAVVSSYYYGADPSQRYRALSGSSVAAAHVAGGAALLLQLHPTWRQDDVRAALMATARNHDLDTDSVTTASVLDIGAGMVDLARLAEPSLVFDPPSISLPHIAPGASVTVTVQVHDQRASGAARDLTPAVLHVGQLHWTHAEAISLLPGQTATVTLGITLAHTATPGDESAYLTLTDSDGTAQLPLDEAHCPIWAHIDPLPQEATVLLLDNDFSQFADYPDYAPFIVAALDEAEISYELWDADAHFGQPQTIPDLATLLRYDVVIWLTGDSARPDGYFQLSTPLTAIDQQILALFLDQGGRLVAIGQNLAEASDVNPDADLTWGRATFYHHYLGAHWIQGTVFGPGASPPDRTASVWGAPGSFLHGVGLDLGGIGDGADNQSSIDEIGPGGLPDGSDLDLVQPLLFAVGAAPLADGYVALSKASEPSLERPFADLPYRTLYYAFGWEGINGNTGFTTRTELLSRSIDWLRDELVVTMDDPIIGGAHRPVELSCQGASSVGAALRQYRWRVGEGDAARTFSSTGSTVQVLFDERGTYPVMVEVTDALGHKQVAEGEVQIVAGGASRLDGYPLSVHGGETVTYTVRAINTEPVTMTIGFTLPLPAGVTYLGHSGQGAQYAANALTWRGDLPSGGKAVATLVVETPSVGSGKVSISATAEFETHEGRFTRRVVTPVNYLYHIVVMPIVMQGWASP